MAWHNDMQTMSAAIADTRQRAPQGAQPFGSAKPMTPTASEAIHRKIDELMMKIKRGEITLEEGKAIMAPLLGVKNPETGLYSDMPPMGQVNTRVPVDPYDVRQTIPQTGR